MWSRVVRVPYVLKETRKCTVRLECQETVEYTGNINGNERIAGIARDNRIVRVTGDSPSQDDTWVGTGRQSGS